LVSVPKLSYRYQPDTDGSFKSRSALPWASFAAVGAETLELERGTDVWANGADAA